MAERDIAQCPTRAKVAHHVARLPAQYVVRYRNQRVFFTKELTVFADKDQAINVGINDDSKVALRFRNKGADLVEVLAQGFWIVRKMPRGLAMQAFDARYAQSLEEHGYCDTASRRYRIDRNGKSARPNGLDIN
jgi:hypothetical protein